jgi:hypothetical protein
VIFVRPAGAIIAGANAGLNWLDRVEPDLDMVRNALRRVVTSGHSVDVMIEDIRAHFKIGARTRTSLDIGDVIQAALLSCVTSCRRIGSSFKPTSANGCRRSGARGFSSSKCW